MFGSAGRARRIGWVAVAVLTALGAVSITVAVLGQQDAPQPPPSAAVGSPPSSAAVGSPPSSAAVGSPPSSAAVASPPATVGAVAQAAPPAVAAAPAGPVLARSQPVALDVPGIGVHSDMLTLGLNPDRTVEVPPLGPVSQAGWYRESPTPGEIGPAVLLGHIDSARYGPGVFFRLGALRPGDRIDVTRADRTVAGFRVDRVVTYPKAAFPSLEVYGNTPDAQLRLITCGGVFDPAARSYQDNIVVYASIDSVRPA